MSVDSPQANPQEPASGRLQELEALVSRLRKQNERAIAVIRAEHAWKHARTGASGGCICEWCEAALADEESEAKGALVERIPSHHSDELPRYIQIDRLNFRVDAETLTGRELRYLPTPPIPDNYDLWKVGVMEPDRLVKAEDVIDLRGARFFSAPRFINAGWADEESKPRTSKCICAPPYRDEEGVEVFGNEDCPVHFPEVLADEESEASRISSLESNP